MQFGRQDVLTTYGCRGYGDRSRGGSPRNTWAGPVELGRRDLNSGWNRRLGVHQRIYGNEGSHWGRVFNRFKHRDRKLPKLDIDPGTDWYWRRQPVLGLCHDQKFD